MRTYKITLEIISANPPDWIVPAIEDQLEGEEAVKYFDYTIEESTGYTCPKFEPAKEEL